MPKARLEVGNTIQAARVSLAENASIILRVTALFSVLSALSALVNLAGAAGLALSFGLLVLFGAIYGGMVTALLCIPGKTEGMGELWSVVRPVLARLIWVTLVTAACFFLGLLAFFIPGLIIITIWAVAGQSIVVERKGVFESLGRSYEMVQGNGWRVFFYLLLLGLLTLLLLGLTLLVTAPLGDGLAGTLVASFLSNLLSAPVAAIGTAVLYNQLSELERNSGPAEEEDPYSAG